MKYFGFFSICIVMFFGFSVVDVYAPPSYNPDWQSYPYCPGGCSNEYLKTEWAKYYDVKGSEWMEQKKQEMLFAMDNGGLEQWLDDPTRANSNVYQYYFYQGEIPNYEGKFVEQVFLEKDLRDLETHLKQNQIPLGSNGLSMNLTIFVVLVGGCIMGIIFVIWRKRK